MLLRPDNKCFFCATYFADRVHFLRRRHRLPVCAAGIYPNIPAFLIVAQGAKNDF